MNDASTPLDDPSRFVRAGILFYGAMAIAAVLWRVGAYGEPMWSPGSGCEVAVATWPLIQSLGTGLGIAAVVILVSWLLTERTEMGRKLASQLAEQLPPLSVPDAVLLACASGLAEEMFFRGALQPRTGLIAASVLFGILHMPSSRALWPWTGFALWMGFVLGWLFEVSGSLVGPIVAHTLINAVNLPLLASRYRGSGEPAEPEGD